MYLPGHTSAVVPLIFLGVTVFVLHGNHRNVGCIEYLNIERYSVYHGGCACNVLQLTDFSGFCEGLDNGDFVCFRATRLLSMCFWCETHFVKDGLCDFVDVTICHIPEVRDQSWAAAVELIRQSNRRESLTIPQAYNCRGSRCGQIRPYL